MQPTVQQLLEQLGPIRRLVVGVSGGVDSVVLAHQLHALGYELIVAHLNHGLRGEASDEDAQFVQRFADQLGVKCVVDARHISRSGNLEQNAREVRYHFLEEVRRHYKADFIAVAHHLDDQIETVLMHILRGAGLRGARGMLVQQERLIRPLITTPKTAILKYAHKHHLEYRTDESNHDLRFTRNQLRHELIPELQKTNPDLIKQVLDMMIDAQTYWHDVRAQADDWLNEYYNFHRFERAAFLKLPRDVQVEVLFSLVDPNGIYEKTIQSVLDLIRSGKTGKQRTVHSVTFLVEYDQVRIVSASSEAWSTHEDRKPLTDRLVRWYSWRLKNSSKKHLWVRSWQPGDRFEPNGMSGTKKVQDFFVDQKVPKIEREHVPIVVDEHDTILAIGGHRFSKKGAFLKPFLLIEKT